MFDAHAHIGENERKALVCTSAPDEFEAVKAYPCRALGILGGKTEELFLLEEAIRKDEEAFIGEIGLDARYSWDEDFFKGALALAKKYSRPFVLHVVRRHEEVLRILKAVKVETPFMVHCFTSSPQIAGEYEKLGGIISLSPLAKRTRHYEKLILRDFLLESDLPVGKDSWNTLKSWYDTVAKDLNITFEELEGTIDERRAVFAPKPADR